MARERVPGCTLRHPYYDDCLDVLETFGWDW